MVGVVGPAGADRGQREVLELVERASERVAHVDVLVGQVDVEHRRVVGVQRHEHAGVAHPHQRVRRHRVDEADAAVRCRADGEGDALTHDVTDEFGVVEQAEPVVDAFDPDHVESGADVAGRALLAEVHRRVEAELAGASEGFGEGREIDALLTGVAPDPDQQLSVATRGGFDELGGGARARGLVDVEDHAAHDGMVGGGVGDPGRDP